MPIRTWNADAATARIQRSIEVLPTNSIEIREYVRDTNLSDLSLGVAYRVDGVHLYADILNLEEILNTTAIEGETSHRRALRFLNLHYRGVNRILDDVNGILVDFHNQRLHSLFAKPYDSEENRIHKAVATAQLMIDVLAETGEGADHPPAKVRVGIDSGVALAVTNGRRGHKEPLFLGEPANHAAKRAGGGTEPGIYLTNEARKTIGLPTAADPDLLALTAEEIEISRDNANLTITKDQVLQSWAEDLEAYPIGKFEFSGHSLPFADLDIETLSPRNSRRQDGISIYADIDAFTAFVSENITNDESAKNVVQALHVLRAELDAVLHVDFKGRKIRFIGDCVHGVLAEGTAHNTDPEISIENAALCAAAMRSSFDIAKLKLDEAGNDVNALGLAVGFDYGPISITRLGMKGELIRSCIGRTVIASESEQRRCEGDETAIGARAFASASEKVKSIFGAARKVDDLTYESAVEGLAENSISRSMLRPAAVAAASSVSFPAQAAKIGKIAGFA